MEVLIMESPKYHQLVTTDKDLATKVYSMHEKSATIITINKNDQHGNLKETVYKISYKKGE